MQGHKENVDLINCEKTMKNMINLAVNKDNNLLYNRKYFKFSLIISLILESNRAMLNLKTHILHEYIYIIIFHKFYV